MTLWGASALKYLCRVNRVEISSSEVFLRLRLREQRVTVSCRSFITEAVGHEVAFEKALTGSVRRFDLVVYGESWSMDDGSAPAAGFDQPEPGNAASVLRGRVTQVLGKEFRVDCGQTFAGGLILDAWFRPGDVPPPGSTVIVRGELCAWLRDAGVLAEALGRPSLDLGETGPNAVELQVKPASAIDQIEFSELELLLSRAYTDGPHLYHLPWMRGPEGDGPIRAAHSIDPALRKPLPADVMSEFPSVRRWWGGRYLGLEPVSTHVLLRTAGWLVSQATIIPRTLRIGQAALTPIDLPVMPGTPGFETTAASVEDVATDPEARGLGYGRAVMRRLADEAARRGHRLALLCTGSPRFYTDLGWRHWTGPAYYSEGERLLPMPPGELMILPLDRSSQNELDSWLADSINVGDGPF